MIKTYHDYIEEVREKINKYEEFKVYKLGNKNLTKAQVEQIIKRFERYISMCFTNGYAFKDQISFRPYTSPSTQYILSRIYSQKKLLKKQEIFNHYAKKKVQTDKPT